MKYKEIKINNLIISDNYFVYNYEENKKEYYPKSVVEFVYPERLEIIEEKYTQL